MALAMGKFAVYSDEVFTSTDLNRRSGEVLNHARKNPVTISRNNEQFALMRREDAASLVNTVDRLKEVMDLFQGVVSIQAGMEPAPLFVWVKALKDSERLAMVQEILKGSSNATTPEEWEAIGDTVYEWRESALVAQRGIIEQVLSQPSEETALTVPVREETEPCDAGG